MKTRTKLALLLLFAAAGGALFVFRNPDALSTEVIHATRGTAVQAVYAAGTVEPSVMLPISAKTPARLMELKADEGADVKKGDVLARLEDSDVQKSLEELQAKEEFTRKDYERKKSLLGRGYETRSSVDAAESAWNAAKAARERSAAEAGFLTLTAPADGKIIKRDGEIGQLIPANQTLMWMSCCAPLRVSAEVDEEDIPHIKTGQEVVIRADAFPGKIFHGTLQSITPKGDPVARSYRVRIAFKEETPLLIGMTAESNIIIGERQNALLVPSSTISQSKLWIVENGKLHNKKVSLGAKGAEKTEVLDGIDDKTLIVLEPELTFKEGQSIRTREAKVQKPMKTASENKE